MRAYAVVASSGSAASGRCSVSHSSSFIVRPVEVGAQLGARAVDAGADRADRDAGGVRDLACRSARPRRAAAGRRGRRRRPSRSAAARSGPSARASTRPRASSVKSHSSAGGSAARRGGRRAEAVPEQVGGDAVEPGAGVGVARVEASRARRRRPGTSRRRGPPPRAGPGHAPAEDRLASGGRRPPRTPPRRAASAAISDASGLSRWSSTGTDCRRATAQRCLTTASRTASERRRVWRTACHRPRRTAGPRRSRACARVHDVAVGEHAPGVARSSPARSGPAGPTSCTRCPAARVVWIAQPSEESSSVAATPPCTEPIGLYIHSAGVMAKITRPSSTSVISKSSSWAIGGGGSSPAAILRIASMPGSEAAAMAVSSGSDQVKVRTRSCPCWVASRN